MVEHTAFSAEMKSSDTPAPSQLDDFYFTKEATTPELYGKNDSLEVSWNEEETPPTSASRSDEGFEWDGEMICDVSHSYRSIRKYEINLLRYKIEKDVIKSEGGGNTIYFGEFSQCPFNEEDSPIELFPHSQANVPVSDCNPRSIVRQRNSDDLKLAWNFPSQLPLEFPMIAESLSCDAEKKQIISSSDMGHLYHAGSRYIDSIADNVVLLMNMAFGCCKAFTLERKRLIGVTSRAIYLLCDEDNIVREFGAKYYQAQVSESFTDCERLQASLLKVRKDVEIKLSFFQNHAQGTVRLVENLFNVDSCVLKAHQHYLSSTEDLCFGNGECYFPQLPAYHNTMKFLRSQDPHTVVADLQGELASILRNMREVEESLITVLDAHRQSIPAMTDSHVPQYQDTRLQ
ncbi:uncharacterized protein CXQ87_001299 [Candidozyma duobushaemuli]|uniref:Uncharacterized protein n=2 Tax=Candidozyma TaxID=3303203 RepID=A0ABX8I4V7_9ASCO|nr:uncharacterized protein CXQ87_001299 [[Candida] duobushaemulonis]PVH18374.1 hypothetical protein CXQ87_001299 [[Candida] duobushaemulonis]QWU86913.1 hypothetical protein CA3LBN_001131 [[Candida] haemuloni]